MTLIKYDIEKLRDEWAMTPEQCLAVTPMARCDFRVHYDYMEHATVNCLCPQVSIKFPVHSHEKYLECLFIIVCGSDRYRGKACLLKFIDELVSKYI